MSFIVFVHTCTVHVLKVRENLAIVKLSLQQGQAANLCSTAQHMTESYWSCKLIHYRNQAVALTLHQA